MHKKKAKQKIKRQTIEQQCKQRLNYSSKMLQKKIRKEACNPIGLSSQFMHLEVGYTMYSI